MPTAAMRLPWSCGGNLRRASPPGLPRGVALPPRRPVVAAGAPAPPRARSLLLLSSRPAPCLLLLRRPHNNIPTAATTTTTTGAAAAATTTTTTVEATSTAKAQNPTTPQFYAGKRAVVVGAGPAGSATAIFLARQGFSVDVYDRRPEPRDDAVDSGRAYVIIAIPRGRKVLDELGVALGPEAEEALMRRPGDKEKTKEEEEGGSSGSNDDAPSAPPPPPRAGTVRHAADGKITSSREDGNVQLSRSALAQALIDAAREQSSGGGDDGRGPGSIAFHFNWSAEGGVDLRERRVTFTRTRDGGQQGQEEEEGAGGSDQAAAAVAPFDLLVGADGAGSVVRAAFAAADASSSSSSSSSTSLPPFSFTVEDTGREYKTYASVPGADRATGEAILPEPEGLEGAATLHLWRPKKCRDGRWDRFASFTTHSNPDGTYSGTMALRKGGFEALEALEASAASSSDADKKKEAIYASFLREAFSGVPPAWVPLISQQLARQARPRSAGRRVRCSRLWDGSRAVLVGDAAHGVSPVFGQGMNSSLESASVLARALRESALEVEAAAAKRAGAAGDATKAAPAAVDAALDAAPRRFDAERREDAHALVALDRKAFSFFGAGPLTDALQLLAHVLVGSALGRLVPRLYGRRGPALLTSLGAADTSYGTILREVRRDAAAAAAGLLALAAWLASKAWAASRGGAAVLGGA